MVSFVQRITLLEEQRIKSLYIPRTGGNKYGEICLWRYTVVKKMILLSRSGCI